jgi:hypothetical protein
MDTLVCGLWFDLRLDPHPNSIDGHPAETLQDNMTLGQTAARELWQVSRMSEDESHGQLVTWPKVKCCDKLSISATFPSFHLRYIQVNGTAPPRRPDQTDQIISNSIP